MVNPDFGISIANPSTVKISNVAIDGKNSGGTQVTDAAILLSGNANVIAIQSGSDNNTAINVPQVVPQRGKRYRDRDRGDQLHQPRGDDLPIAPAAFRGKKGRASALPFIGAIADCTDCNWSPPNGRLAADTQDVGVR